MLLYLDGNGRDRMTFAIFFHSDADEDHQHDKRDNALLFRRKNEKIHRSGLTWMEWK